MKIKFKDNPFKKTVNRRKRLSFIARLFKKRYDAALDCFNDADMSSLYGNDTAYYDMTMHKGNVIANSSPFKFMKP